jgi:PAS domain S-box-containing protein
MAGEGPESPAGPAGPAGPATSVGPAGPQSLVSDPIGHLAAIVQSSEDAIISKRLDGTITSWNKAAERMFGYPSAEAVGRSIRLIVPEERWEEEDDVLRRVARGETVEHFETVRLRRDGSQVEMSLTVSPIRDEAGRIVGASKIGRDITGRKRAERAAAESEQRFRIMADGAPVMVWMSGPDRLYEWFNRPWLELTGRTLEQELGSGWSDGLHPDDRERALDEYASAFEARRELRREYRLRRADGEYRWILDTAVPRFTSSGELGGYIGSCIDLTERRQAEEERALLLAQAQAANRAKDEFLSILSHELRTPLNAILGWSEVLRQRRADPVMMERGLEAVSRNVKAQTRLIDDLLDVSKIDAGKMRLDVRAVELAPIVSAALEAIGPAAEAKQIRLQPVLDPSGVVLGDPDRLQQIVWNLVSNAVKFTPKHGRVQVVVSRINSHVEITVSDTGKGIASEYLPYVFERFSQADSSLRRQFGGLGLGLTIARDLVELHGGTIEARSEGEGRGATFVVKLPRSLVTAPPPGGPREHPSAEAAGAPSLPFPQLDGLRVLVVDDDPGTREVTAAILGPLGAEVVLAASAPEALDALVRRRPDVLVADIEMPGEDGYSLIKSVRSLPVGQGGATPAAALTAFARAEDRWRALDAGFQLHLAKPVEPLGLAIAVAHLAGRAADRRSTRASDGRPSDQ